MERTRSHIDVTLVSPNGSLEALAKTLRRDCSTIDVTVVDRPEDLAGTDVDLDADTNTNADREPADCIVVCHANDVDGVAQLEAVLDCVGGSTPVVVYSLVHELEPVTASITAGAADVICPGADSPSLLERRLRAAAGDGPPPQSPARRLESLLEYLPHQVFLKDDHHRIVDASRVAADEYGLTREQMIGLTDFELLQPEVAEELFAEERRIMETGEPIINKIEHYVDRQGRDRWVSTSKAARYDGGVAIGVLGSTRDVTEQQRQEQLLDVLHEASRDLVSASNRADVAHVAVAIAEDIPDLPRICIALLEDGHLEPACDDRAVFDRFGDAFDRSLLEDRAQYLDASGIETTLADGAVVAVLPLGSHGVLAFETTSGTLEPFSVDLAQILAANVEVALDRAEREARLQSQNERLEQFASIVSHDLRNPMSTARGYLEAYRDSGDPAHADEIEHALDRMERLTDEMLELARHGRIVASVEPVELAVVVDRAWRNVPTEDAVLEHDLEGVTYGDSERVQEALENLFRNSVEHGLERTAGGGRIRVERLPRGFAVEDDGPGIPDSRKDEAFDLGYTGSVDGTGYGLYIVEQIVTGHDWSIRVTDGEDGGARFEITGLEFDS
ncbi:PAS domain-containing sensor histidine kinase [Natronosalvus halobius]|uniref:PAS domain-containing sensor histidine kinase n=1 Tax=Natronosalvus halobius TaxID=2953746 RepID=UPI0020A17490|nr:PAS domain-containing sensor histidine kinase [Natronosalvus halobius]USZ71166.1 PAS domain-containing sensor histidine kinase [Natronosalvus halobius]